MRRIEKELGFYPRPRHVDAGSVTTRPLADFDETVESARSIDFYLSELSADHLPEQ